MDYSIYETYTRGYTGHIPKIQTEEHYQAHKHTKHIPNYAGYVPSIHSENVFGKSYGRLSAESLQNKLYKGADIGPAQRYTSIAREDFIDRSRIPNPSTAELLGVANRENTFKKPIPIDTINKFWGIDAKKASPDNVVLLSQAKSQAYSNFWSFANENKITLEKEKKEDFDANCANFWGVQKKVQELYPDLKFSPIPGYQGFDRSVKSENIYGATYRNGLVIANKYEEEQKKQRAKNLIKSSKFY